MKKALRIIVGILLVIPMIGIFMRILPSSAPSPDSSIREANTIEYKAVIDGEVCEIPEFLFDRNGSYPTEYTPGKTLKVDDLNGSVSVISDFEPGENELPLVTVGGYSDPIDSQKDYRFYGWYTDEALTIPFEGKFGSRATGRKTLYAKIDVSYWTKFY